MGEKMQNVIRSNAVQYTLLIGFVIIQIGLLAINISLLTSQKVIAPLGDDSLTLISSPDPSDQDSETSDAEPIQQDIADSQSISLAGQTLYVDPTSQAANALQDLTLGSEEHTLIYSIASQPQATWFGEWNPDITSDVDTLVSVAHDQDQVPVLVLYNIPVRDCFGHSEGGVASADLYRDWIDRVAVGINDRKALIILEPDALPLMNCLDTAQQETRYQLLSYAVETLASENVWVYLDAGHPTWIAPQEIADRLEKANISQARGFSLNVSNFAPADTVSTYGNQISEILAGKPYVIDTSRNGNGSPIDGSWCNPPEMALGKTPTFDTNNPLLDAYLWVKRPGESDGECNGGPSAGTWWPEYALELVRNSR